MNRAFGRTSRICLQTALLCLCVAAPVNARSVRRLFEPTDLELESSGTAEFDLQLGAIRGPDAFRVAVPDFEFDLGLTKQLELDIDGALGLEGPDSGALHYDHVTSDNLWLALKAGLLSFEDQTRTRVLSSGLQVGPKLPTANQARGVGVESLFLLGIGFEHTHVILNLGALLDPPIGGTSRPCGFEGGVDFDLDLDQSGKWSLTGEVGTVRFLSPDANQLHTTAGLAWNPTNAVTFSLVGLAGLLRGSDRYGIVVGVSPKMRLWGG